MPGSRRSACITAVMVLPAASAGDASAKRQRQWPEERVSMQSLNAANASYGTFDLS